MNFVIYKDMMINIIWEVSSLHFCVWGDCEFVLQAYKNDYLGRKINFFFDIFGFY